MQLTTLRLAILVTATMLRAPYALADCWFYEIHCIAADAGRNAGLEAAKTIAPELPGIGMKTMNYWGYLLEKYHAGTPQEHDWAKKIIVGELGIDPDAANINRAFEISLTLTGLRTTTKESHLDVAMLEDADEVTIKPHIEAGAADSMSDFRRIDWPVNVAAPQESVNLEQLRALLFERLERGPELTPVKCKFYGSYMGGTNQQPGSDCTERDAAQKILNDKFEADLLVLAVNPTTPRRTGAEVRFVWMLNPQITIVIPKHELDEQPDLAAQVSVYRIKDDGTREPTRRFLNARTLSHQDLTIAAQLYTSNKYVDGHNQYYGRRMEIYSP